MSCAETLATQAFIDGEVTGADAEAAERHIAGCAHCQAFVEAAASLSDDLRTLAPRHAPPPGLWPRVQAALDAEEARQAAVHAEPRRAIRRSFWRGAFGGAALSGLTAAVAVFAILPPSAATLADALGDAHVRALMSGHAIEVASTDHHTVKPWFAGRIALSPPVADFEGQGFKLTGGRLDHVAGAPAAVVVYQHGRHQIDLFVWADRGGNLPASGLRHGYRSVVWKSGDLDLAAVSDVQSSELARFVGLVRAERE